MKMTCGNRAIKYIMFAFNFVFVITGIIILAVGASVKAHYYPYDTILDDKYFSLPNMLIATGSLIFIISFLGCYGAIKENWIILMAFSVLLGIIFIFELSVGIAGYVLRDKTSVYLETELYTSMSKYTTSPVISSMWDTIQEEFECCGVLNYSDWRTTFQNNSLPVSCCPKPSGIVGAFYCNSYAPSTETTSTEITTIETISTTETTTAETESTTTETTSTTEETTIPSDQKVEEFLNNNTDVSTYPPSSSDPYIVGCKSVFGDFVKKHAVDIGAVGIALAVIQLAGIFLSFHLATQLKNGYYST